MSEGNTECRAPVPPGTRTYILSSNNLVQNGDTLCSTIKSRRSQKLGAEISLFDLREKVEGLLEICENILKDELIEKKSEKKKEKKLNYLEKKDVNFYTKLQFPTPRARSMMPSSSSLSGSETGRRQEGIPRVGTMNIMPLSLTGSVDLNMNRRTSTTPSILETPTLQSNSEPNRKAYNLSGSGSMTSRVCRVSTGTTGSRMTMTMALPPKLSFPLKTSTSISRQKVSLTTPGTARSLKGRRSVQGTAQNAVSALNTPSLPPSRSSTSTSKNSFASIGKVFLQRVNTMGNLLLGSARLSTASGSISAMSLCKQPPMSPPTSKKYRTKGEQDNLLLQIFLVLLKMKKVNKKLAKVEIIYIGYFCRLF